MHTCQQRGWPGLVLFLAASHCCFNSISQAEAEAILLSLSAAGILYMHLHAITQPLQLLTPCSSTLVVLWMAMLTLHKLTVSQLHKCRHQQLCLFQMILSDQLVDELVD